MDLTQLLAFTMQNSASDLHLSAGSPPIIRTSGSLKKVKADPLSSDDIRTMLYSVMTEDQRAEYEKNMEIDFAIALGEKARFRVNGFTSRLGACAVFRTIPTEIPTMEDLGLPPVMRRFAELERGIVLVTGPTGSGKSTTLASMVNHINLHESKHILTIEDPVEFFHSSHKSLVNHREVGTDTNSFARALKSALREDPDVILVGEMRDYETISLALTAAETGHLVFGTLHSNSAAKTVDRIIDVFPTGDKEMIRAMLASSLQGVIAQTLLKKQGGGRVGAYEILVGTNAVRNLIRENQIPQLFSMMQTGSRYGMITMEEAIKDLYEAGIISKDEARRAVLKAADQEDDEGEKDDEYIDASLGGTKIDAEDTKISQRPASQSSTKTSDSSPKEADGGYSF
ncbi:MAG: type IV pilus twitching motility protein PilT [Alphaproteobacteria bacterium]